MVESERERKTRRQAGECTKFVKKKAAPGSLARNPIPIIRPAGLLSSPALDVRRLMTALQVASALQVRYSYNCTTSTRI